MWFNIYESMSYNALFNFIVGPRGNGKTFGFKKWAIKDFLKTGNQFVYVRRYKEEMKKMKTFFNDIQDEFPEVEFQVDKGCLWINKQVAGYYIPLSTSKIMKSVAFPEVTKICFDEFIIERKGVYHYLNDEVTYFLELYETIARMREVKVYFLSNALTVTNPYFAYFKISMPHGKNIARKGEILIQVCKDQEFIESKKNTRFGKLIAGSKYAKYSIENEFVMDSKTFIQRKTENARYLFTMQYKGNNYGVYIDYKAGLMFVSNSVDSTCKLIYAMTTDDHSPNTMLLKSKRQSVMIKMLVEQYNLGNVRFEDINIKNIVTDVICMTM